MFQIGIACRLHFPSDTVMEDTYGPSVIKAVLFATYFYMFCLGGCLVPTVVIYAMREFCTITVVELD
jgi:hypothetical protein